MESTTLVTPVGRIVQGHPLNPITKDMQGRTLLFKDGSPRTNFFFALAVKKSNKKIDFFIETIEEIAKSSFPRIQNLSFPSSNFSWKIKDGDVPDAETGEVKQGFAGCWIISFSNSFCSEVVDIQTRQPIINKEGIKCGDYVQVVASVKGNGNREKPGVYMNQVSVGKVMDGEPIVSTKSYIHMFDAVSN